MVVDGSGGGIIPQSEKRSSLEDTGTGKKEKEKKRKEKKRKEKTHSDANKVR